MPLPIKYHWRNLFTRRTTTLLTVLVVASVVGTLTWILGFSAALSATLSMAGDNHKLLIIRRGSDAETNSAIQMEEYNRLAQVTGVDRAPDGAALISPELMLQVSLPRNRDAGKTSANIAVRGVTDAAFLVHKNVRLLGPKFSTQQPELIVGKRAAEQFAGLEIGKSIRLGSVIKREFKIVAHFTADGGPLESEIWGYLPALQNIYNRQSVYSSAALRVAPDASPQSLIDQISAPPIQLSAETEPAYWTRQSSNFDLYKWIAASLVAIIAVAAAFAVANTLYSMVAGRAREIAMLRTIGFSGRSILIGFVLEAVMLSLLGGLLGVLGCSLYLFIVGNTKDMFGARTFTTLAFEIHLTPALVALALALVVLIGILGAIAPALRASRLQIISALRQA